MPVRREWFRCRSNPCRIALVCCCLSAAATAQNEAKIPELILPGDDPTALPEGVVRRFGPADFRSGGVTPYHFSPAEPFFSPDGGTLYIPGSFSVMAIDTSSGRMRFHYRYSQYNVTIWNEGENGVRMNFTQGQLNGQYTVIEHGTGKELSRGKQAVLKGTPAYLEFANGTRALATQIERGDLRKGGRELATAYLYDVANGKILAELGAGGRLHNSVLSPDRKRLVFCNEDSELTVFDADSGLILRSVPLGLKANGDETFPVWSKDGKTVYSWRRNQEAAELVSIDVDQGDVRVLVKENRWMIRSSPAVSPDGAHLAYQLDDNPWEKNSYWRILRLADLTEAHVIDVRPAKTWGAFSPDSKSFWMLSGSGLARFDLETGKLDPRTADTLTHTDALAFSADGTKIYSVTGGQLITWDVATGEEIEPRQSFEDQYCHQAGMRCLHIGDNGRRTIWTGRVAGSEQQGSQVHAVEKGKKIGSFYAANAQRHQEYDISADTKYIVHDAYHGELKLAELWTGAAVHELMPQVRPRKSHVFALAPDNRTLALVHQGDLNANDNKDIEIELWDLDAGRKTDGIRMPGNDQMKLQFSQCSRELRVIHRAEWSVWDVRNRNLIRKRAERSQSHFLESTPNRHWQARFSFRGGDRILELVDVHSGLAARTWEHPKGHITAVAFSQDSKQMAVAANGTTAALYHLYDPGPSAPDLSKREVSQLIAALGGEDVPAGYLALCELIRRGDDVLPALAAALSRSDVSSDAIAELIPQLDNPEFEVRDAATKKLLAMPAEIGPQLRAAMEQGGTQEKLTRLKRILAKLRDGDVARDRLVVYRVVEALAAIRTPAALKLLEETAAGSEDAIPAREARATLRR